MTGESYEGYTNRDTWVVGLWIDNDYQTYHLKLNADISTAEKAKQFVEKNVPLDVLRGILKDVGGSLKNVNWQELSEEWIEEQNANTSNIS